MSITEHLDDGTILHKSDMRSAITYLSTKNRKHAIKGEVIIDKIAGEILLKRPIDGKIISYCQLNKATNESMMELGLLRTNYPNITYPENLTPYFAIHQLFDVEEIMQKEVNILGTDVVGFATNTDSIVKIIAAKDVSGCFIRPTIRLTDMNYVEIITSIYNNFCKNYTGTNITIANEKQKFDDNTWEFANASLSYSVIAYNEAKTKYYQTDIKKMNIKFGAFYPIDFTKFTDNFLSTANDIIGGNPDHYEVRIHKIEFDKLKWLISNQGMLPETIINGLNAFKPLDNQVLLKYIHTYSFLTDSTIMEVFKIENQQIVSLFDSITMKNQIGYNAKIRDQSDVIFSIERPSSALWLENTIWGEMMTTISPNGNIMENLTETKFADLYSLLSYRSTIDTYLTRIETDVDGMFINPDTGV